MPRRRAPGTRPPKRKSRYAQKRSDLDTPKALLQWDAEFPPKVPYTARLISRRVASMASGEGRPWVVFFRFWGHSNRSPRRRRPPSSPSATRIRDESVCATVDALARANLGDDVYLRRETLTTSLEGGRPVELLTIHGQRRPLFGDEPLDWHAPQIQQIKVQRGGLAFSISRRRRRLV